MMGHLGLWRYGKGSKVVSEYCERSIKQLKANDTRLYYFKVLLSIDNPPSKAEPKGNSNKVKECGGETPVLL
jgi:hypothetical protein